MGNICCGSPKDQKLEEIKITQEERKKMISSLLSKKILDIAMKAEVDHKKNDIRLKL